MIIGVVGVDKKSIVDSFLSSGVLLSPNELVWLSGRSDSEIAEVSSSDSPREELASRMSRHVQYDILKNIVSVPSQLTPSLQTSFFNSRYQRMKAVVEQRINREWVSLNRLPPRGDVFIAGIARSITEGETCSVEIEDPTGTVFVTFAGKIDFGLDDFVALRATISNGAVAGKEVLNPDVPIRPAARGSGRGCFLPDLRLDEAPQSDVKRLFAAVSAENPDYLFAAGDIGDMAAFENICGSVPVFLIPGEIDGDDLYPQPPLKSSRPNVVCLSNPGAIRVGGLSVLLCHRFDVGMLRRRHLGPQKGFTEEDTLVMDFIPDIVGCGHGQKPFVTNYKSATIVTSGSMLGQAAPVLVDFTTREFKYIRA